MGGAYFLLLSSLSLAVTVQAQACTSPMGNNMSLKDDFITLTEFPDGITVSFACNFGYETAGGSPKITCANGVWSPLSLRCQKKSCGPAGEVENGLIDYPGGAEFGATATVTCNRGYYAIGSRELICGDGKWLNRVPVCEVINCDPPPNIVNGTFKPIKESYAYGDVVQYTCKINTLDGRSSLTCSDSGKFEPDPPKCTHVQCPEPNIKNGFWKDGSRPPYGHKSSVTYECEKGYSLKGQRTIICNISSQWSPGLPECIPIEATSKPTTTTTTTTSKGTTPDTYTPTPTPGSGGDKKYAWFILLGVVVGVAGVGGGKYISDQKKKRKQVLHHEKGSTNKDDTVLCPINSPDVKDDATEQMNSNP